MKQTNCLYLLTTWIFLLLISCSTNQEQKQDSTINISSSVGKYEVLNLSDYVESIEYIPLEVNDSILITKIEQIAYENETFVIKDGYYSCKVFDRHGKYTQSLGSIGQGPDEFIVIRMVDVIPQTKNVFLNASPDKLFLYNLVNGELLERIKSLRSLDVPFTSINTKYLSPNIFIADICNYLDTENAYATFRYDGNKTEIINIYKNPFLLTKELEGFSSHERAIMYRYQNQVRTYKTINDTVYSFNQDASREIAFIFDFGKYRTPTEWLFEARPRKTGDYIHVHNILESDKYLFLEFLFLESAPEPFEYIKEFSDRSIVAINKNVYGIYSKESGELKLMKQPIKKQLGFHNDIDDGFAIWPSYISSTNQLISFCTAEEFLNHFNKISNPSEQIRKVLSKIDEDSNPVVMIMQLK